MLVTADLKVGQGSSLFTSATTDSDGRVSFTWNNGTSLSAAAPSFSGAFIDLLQSGGTAFGVAGPVNAASFVQGVSPGGIAKLFGSNLAGDVQVRLDGKPAKVLSASDRQVDFFVPLDQSPGTVRLTVESGGWSAGLDAPVMPVSPGIFVDAYTGYGAVVNAATSLSTRDQPAARGDYVEIYCTGLGPAGDAAVLPRVTIGGVPAEVAHSGPAPGDPGLYRVDARIPADAPAGEPPLSLTVDGVQSNVVRIGIR